MRDSMSKLNLEGFTDPPTQRARIEEQISLEEYITRPMPSRKIVTENQINIRAENDVLDAFKQLCKIERRTYGDMLNRLIKAYGPPKE